MGFSKTTLRKKLVLHKPILTLERENRVLAGKPEPQGPQIPVNVVFSALFHHFFLILQAQILNQFGTVCSMYKEME